MPRRPYRPTVKPWKEESYRLRLAGFRDHLQREAAQRAELERREAARRRLEEIEQEVAKKSANGAGSTAVAVKVMWFEQGGL